MNPEPAPFLNAGLLDKGAEVAFLSVLIHLDGLWALVGRLLHLGGTQ